MTENRFVGRAGTTALPLIPWGLAALLPVLWGPGGVGTPQALAAPGVRAPAALLPPPFPLQEVRCHPMTDRMPLEGRLSPYDSTLIPLGGATAKICYGRPSSRGRVMIGGERVPYGRLWRTGANEPTTIHLPFASEIAGIRLEPGSYSIYTIPGPQEWVVIVNRSTSQWGHQGRYTPEVQAQEVGRARVKAERLEEHLETFTIRFVPRGEEEGLLILEWERTRVPVPIRRLPAGG